MKFGDEGDRKAAVAFWAVEVAIFAAMFAAVAGGVAPGLEWHPTWYLEATCVMCALLLSVIPALRLAGAVKMPWWLNILLAADVYVYSVSLLLGYYMNPDTMGWWGFFGHVLSSMSVGAVVFLALCLVEKYSPPHVTLGSNAAIHCYTLMISLAFGGIWEVMEGYVDVIAGDSIMVYGNFDTLDDLRADLLGSAIMVFIAGLMMRGRTAADIAGTTYMRNPLKGRGEQRGSGQPFYIPCILALQRNQRWHVSKRPSTGSWTSPSA